MSSNLNYKQVANVTRRTWDKEAYERKAQARQQQAQAEAESGGRARGGRNPVPSNSTGAAAAAAADGAEGSKDDIKQEFVPAQAGAAGPTGSKRAFLKSRSQKVADIDTKVGTTALISAEAAATTSVATAADAADDAGALTRDSGVVKTGVGWHCKVCDCFLKDSHTYLDHINGRKHQRALGYSMRVERSTKSQLMDTLAGLKKKKQEDAAKDPALDLDAAENFDDVVKAKDEEIERRREERRQKRKEKKNKKKQQQQSGETPPSSDNHKDNGDQAGEGKDGAGGEGAEAEEEVETEEVNPDMAAMMGFSGFG